MSSAADRQRWREQKRQQRERIKRGIITLPVPLSSERFDALLALTGLPESAATDLRLLGEAARGYLEAGVSSAIREKRCPQRTSKFPERT
jgi:hypothetical protein